MCRSNCQDKISFEQIKQLFNQYWALGTYDQRILYIGSLLTIGDKKCNILSNAMQRKRGRETSVKYFLEYDGMRTQVCRKHFTICFSETESFIKNVIAKKFQVQANRLRIVGVRGFL